MQKHSQEYAKLTKQLKFKAATLMKGLCDEHNFSMQPTMTICVHLN